MHLDTSFQVAVSNPQPLHASALRRADGDGPVVPMCMPFGANSMIRNAADASPAEFTHTLNQAETEPASEHPSPTPPGRPMRVVERGVYRGPNLYGSLPMIRIQVDLGAL